MNAGVTSNDSILPSDNSSDDVNVFPFNSFSTNDDTTKKCLCSCSMKERSSRSLPNPKLCSANSEVNQIGLPLDTSVHHSCQQHNLQSQECRIFYLMNELEVAKKSNKKLKSVVNSLTTELNDLKCTSRHVISNHYPPGVLTAMVGEVYKAQNVRDVAMMARIRQANDERDDALLQLDELKEKVSSNDIALLKSFGEKWNSVCQEKFASLNDADFLLYNQASLLNDVAHSRRKLGYSPLDSPLTKMKSSTLLGTGFEKSGEEFEISNQSQTPSALNESDENYIQILQQRLQEEITAKNKAQASCLRLERLVAVLRKKINGLALQREESDVDSQGPLE